MAIGSVFKSMTVSDKANATRRLYLVAPSLKSIPKKL
jgi:hypothetical protein